MTINGSTSSSAWTYKLETSESNVNISNNTSVVTVTAYLGRASSRSYIGGTWSGSITVNGSSQSMSGTIPYPTYIDGGAWYTLATKSFTVTHNDDGSKTVGISSNWAPEAGVVPSSASASGNMTLTTIARKSTVSCTNGNIGSNVIISISRKSSSFTHTLTYAFGNLSGTITTKTSSTSVSWTLPNSFYAQIPNANDGIGSITCTTYNGNTSIGSNSCSFRAYVTNANPIFTDFSYIDVGDVGEWDSSIITTDLTGDNSKIIKGYSYLKVETIGTVSSQKSATLSYYQIDNVKVNPSNPVYVRDYDKPTITMSVVDSRGNGTTVTKDISSNFINYFDITKGNISLTRNQGGVGETVTLNYNGTFWNENFGVVQNTIEATYKYKKTTDTTWTTGTTTINPTISNNNYSYSGIIAGDTTQHGFDIDDSYDIQVIVHDKLNGSTFSAILGTGKPAIAVYGNKVSLGDKYDTSLGGIQLWGDIYVNGGSINGYSTTERIVGKWLDGKNLYEITFYTNTSISPSGNYIFAHNISNIDFIKVKEAFVFDTGAKKGYSLPVTLYESHSSNDNLSVKVDSTNITFYMQTGWGSSWVKYVVLQYTKTTD